MQAINKPEKHIASAPVENSGKIHSRSRTSPKWWSELKCTQKKRRRESAAGRGRQTIRNGIGARRRWQKQKFNKNKTRVHFVGKVFFDVWRVEDEQYGGWDPVALIFLRWFSRGRVCNYGDGRVLEFLIGSSHHQRIPHSTLVASAGKGKGTKRKEGIIVFIWDVRMCVYVCLAAGSSQRQGLPTGC